MTDQRAKLLLPTKPADGGDSDDAAEAAVYALFVVLLLTVWAESVTCATFRRVL